MSSLLRAAAFSSSQLGKLDGEARYKKALKQGRGRVVAERERRTGEREFRENLPGFSSILSLSGLTLAPVEYDRTGWGEFFDTNTGMRKSSNRIDQVAQLRGAIGSSLQHNALFVAGGNDFKWFIVRNGVPCEFFKRKEGEIVHEIGLERWKSLSSQEKINFQPKKNLVLDKDGDNHIREKMKEFIKILEGLFSGSNFDKVFISSIFERQIPELDHLEAYFAYINHYLYKGVAGMSLNGNVLNKRGMPITFHYINVAPQFFETDQEEIRELFCRADRESGNLTHRDMPFLRKICNQFVTKMTSVLNETC